MTTEKCWQVQFPGQGHIWPEECGTKLMQAGTNTLPQPEQQL
jgi:hypothetical protein